MLNNDCALFLVYFIRIVNICLKNKLSGDSLMFYSSLLLAALAFLAAIIFLVPINVHIAKNEIITE